MTFFVPLRLAYNSRCPKTCDTKLGGAVLNEDIQEKGIKLNHSCLFTDEVNYTNVGNLFFFFNNGKQCRLFVHWKPCYITAIICSFNCEVIYNFLFI